MPAHESQTVLRRFLQKREEWALAGRYRHEFCLEHAERPEPIAPPPVRLVLVLFRYQRRQREIGQRRRRRFGGAFRDISEFRARRDTSPCQCP